MKQSWQRELIKYHHSPGAHGMYLTQMIISEPPKHMVFWCVCTVALNKLCVTIQGCFEVSNIVCSRY